MEPLYLPVWPAIAGFFVFFTISFIALWSGWRRPTNILFATLTFLSSLVNADVALISILSDEKLAGFIDRLAHVFFIFCPPVYIHFVHHYLKITTRRWLQYLSYGLILLLAFFVPTPLFIKGLHRYDFSTVAQAGMLYHVFSLIVIVTLIYCLTCLSQGMKSTRSNLERNRLKYIIAGMGGCGLFMALNILPINGYHVYPMSNLSFIPALFLAYGFLKYDLLDMGLVLRRTTGYFLLTGILTVSYVIIIGVFNLFFWRSAFTHGFLLSFLLAVIMVVLFNPLRDRFQGLIDQLFFMGRYDYRGILKDLSSEMTSLLDIGQIRELLLGSVFRNMKVSHVGLLLDEEDSYYYYFYDDAGAVEVHADFLKSSELAGLAQIKRPIVKGLLASLPLTEKERENLSKLLDKLKADLLIPMVSRERLVGLICLGQKKSGEIFVQDDLELLGTLANQTTVAMENARSYLALERLNRELELKVQQRTGELLQALEESKRTQDLLIKSESLAAIGQLVAGVAHELNNPLTSAQSLLQSSIEELDKGEVDQEKRGEILDDLSFSLKEIKRAADIVKSLLGVSRQSQTYQEKVQINKVMEDALRVLYNKYKYLSVTIDKHYGEDLPEIYGNFANLSQVMINIIKNAIEAMEGGKGTLKLVTAKKNDKIIVEIIDDGRGMTPEEMKDIFKPFFTTKAVGDGMGLGLYISHLIVEKHRGHISVASEVGKGSSFTVELPIYDSTDETQGDHLL